MDTLATFWWYYPARNHAVHKTAAILIFGSMAWGMMWAGAVPVAAIFYIWVGVSCHTAHRYLKPVDWMAYLEQRQNPRARDVFSQGAVLTCLEVVQLLFWLFDLPHWLVKTVMARRKSNLQQPPPSPHRHKHSRHHAHSSKKEHVN